MNRALSTQRRSLYARASKFKVIRAGIELVVRVGKLGNLRSLAYGFD
jgi:hypothetical protein